MTPDEFRAQLARLGLSQVGAGKALRKNARTVRRWCSGHTPIPHDVALLLPKLSRREAQKLANGA